MNAPAVIWAFLLPYILKSFHLGTPRGLGSGRTETGGARRSVTGFLQVSGTEAQIDVEIPVAQATLELEAVLLSQLSECWDFWVYNSMPGLCYMFLSN